MIRDYPMLIDGQDVEGRGWTYVLRASAMISTPTESFNLKRALELGNHDGPIPEEVEARCAWGTRDDSRRAVQAASRAAQSYAQVPLDDRIQILRDCRDALIQNLDEVIELLIIEGHPRRLAEWEASGLVRNADDATLDWYRQQLQSTHFDGRLQLVRKPDGVVCVNPPQNASGSNGCLGLFALMAGNTLVVKAPRSTPLTVMFIYRELIQDVLDDHGLPPGTLNVISGDSRDILRGWTTSPDVNDIVFFGGSDVGVQIGQECVAAGKKPILELAGNDGLVVWEDADLDQAANALTECFYGSSQICMVPKYSIVHPAVAEEFLEIFLRRVAGIRPGYPEERGTLLSPVLKADLFFDYLAQAREAGCAVLVGGQRIDVDGEPADSGLFFEPTVVQVDGLALANRLSCVREETFFPMLPVVVPEQTTDLTDQVIEFVNTNRYGLRNSLWTSSEAVADEFARRVTNGGQLKINDSHIAFRSVLSGHGGTGLTGGPSGELNYVALRTTHLQGIYHGNGVAQPIDELVQEASLNHA